MLMDTSKSLQELENFDMGEPESAPTDMIRRCLILHRTPLEQWNAEDCRLMLGQKFSPRYLIPIALEFLVGNPMESGDFYPGALLQNILSLPSDFWIKEQDLWWQVHDAVIEVESLKKAIEDLAPQIEKFKKLEAK